MIFPLVFRDNKKKDNSTNERSIPPKRNFKVITNVILLQKHEQVETVQQPDPELYKLKFRVCLLACWAGLSFNITLASVGMLSMQMLAKLTFFFGGGGCSIMQLFLSWMQFPLNHHALVQLCNKNKSNCHIQGADYATIFLLQHITWNQLVVAQVQVEAISKIHRQAV